MEKQTKEVATKGIGGLPANYVEEMPEVLKTDIVVPYMSLGQGMSEAVTERAVQLGDIYKSTQKQKMGDPDHPIEAIFLHYPKADWVIEKKGKSKFEFVRSEPRTASNETLPWSFWADEDGNETEPGVKGSIEHRRVKRMTVFAILPADIAAAALEMAKAAKGELPDPSKALTPVVFSFRSSGYKTGKEVGTFYTQAQSMKVPVWRYQIPMFPVLEQNDEGSFYVWKTDRTKAKGVSAEHLPMVSEWAALINQGAANVMVDEGGDDGFSAAAEPREVNKKAARDIL